MAVSVPEVIIHRFEEKLVIWPIKCIFKVAERHTISSNWELNQIRCILVVDMIYYLCFLHAQRCLLYCTIAVQQQHYKTLLRFIYINVAISIVVVVCNKQYEVIGYTAAVYATPDIAYTAAILYTNVAIYNTIQYNTILFY